MASAHTDDKLHDVHCQMTHIPTIDCNAIDCNAIDCSVGSRLLSSRLLSSRLLSSRLKFVHVVIAKSVQGCARTCVCFMTSCVVCQNKREMAQESALLLTSGGIYGPAKRGQQVVRCPRRQKCDDILMRRRFFRQRRFLGDNVITEIVPNYVGRSKRINGGRVFSYYEL